MHPLLDELHEGLTRNKIAEFHHPLQGPSTTMPRHLDIPVLETPDQSANQAYNQGMKQKKFTSSFANPNKMPIFAILFQKQAYKPWRGGRVVDYGSLENC